MCVRVRLVAAALTLLACGGGRDARFDERQRICQALTAGMTVSQAFDQFGIAQGIASECRFDWAPVPGGADACPYAPTTSVCISELLFFTTDDRGCRGATGNARTCVYGCDLRTVGPIASDLSTPICAAQFLTGLQ